MNNSKAQQAAEEKYPIVPEDWYKDIYKTYEEYKKDQLKKREIFLAGAQWQSSQTPESLLVSAVAPMNRYNLSNYPDMKEDTLVFGYYVKCRGGHYILQEYNNNGYDERWESSEFVEIDFNTLKFVNNE